VKLRAARQFRVSFSMTSVRPVSSAEEIANAVSHGLGLVASLIALPLLIAASTSRGDIRLIIGCSVFGATLVALYTASTIYHALPPSRAKDVLQLIDHSAIYLLIAGSYTPFALGVLRGVWGWSLLGTVWGLAAVGIAYKSLFGLRFPRFSILLYLLMGWLALVAMGPLTIALPRAGLLWLLAGGLLYTAGTVFYLREHPRFSHTVWHLFVLGGSACHVVAVLGYALPSTG
jgi:hemolysin III